MGRKNKRKQSAYYRKMRISQKELERLVSKGTQSDRRTDHKATAARVTEKAKSSGHTASAGIASSTIHTPQSSQLPQLPQRGEIWFAEFGCHPGTSVQEGCRPALIISNDTANLHSSTVTVVPMTTMIKKAHLPTHVVVSPQDVELEQGRHMERSMLLAEQVTTIGKEALTRYVGRLRSDKLRKTETVVLVQMNIVTASDPSSAPSSDSFAVAAISDYSGASAVLTSSAPSDTDEQFTNNQSHQRR